MVKLGNPKNAFWEAFFLALLVFIFGIFMGVAYENSRLNTINEYYALSEIALMDGLAMSNLIDLDINNCDELINFNLDFADRIYFEALSLIKYEDAGKITNDLRLAHKKYDVLRTFLWINNMKVLEKCEGNLSTVVYLYEYGEEDLNKKAINSVWSKVLSDLKQKKGNEILLLSLAVDSDLVSLNSVLNQFEISQYPAVIINNEDVIEELLSVEELEAYL
jgi:hypothetical protein